MNLTALPALVGRPVEAAAGDSAANDADIEPLPQRQQKSDAEMRQWRSEFELHTRRYHDICRRLDAVEAHLKSLTLRPAECVEKGSVSPDISVLPCGSSGPRNGICFVASEKSGELSAAQDTTNIMLESVGHNLSETVWEAPLMFASGMSDIPSNVSIFVAVATNALMQLIFCFVAWRSFLDERFPDVSEVERWRYTVGHDVAWTAADTGSSLVSLVCSNDRSLALATDQRALVGEIEEYTRDTGLFVGPVAQGALLASMAIVMWFLVIWREYFDTGTFMVGILMVWRDGRNEGLMQTRLFRDAGGLKFLSLSLAHFVGMTSIVFLRLLIASILLYVGMWCLANTTSVQDVMLNAAALSFILDCDELVFDTVLTLKTRLLFSQLQPLPRFRSCLHMQNVGRPAFALSGVAVLLGILTSQMLDNIHNMNELSHILCGGNTDFVFTTMPSTSWIVTVPTSSDDGTGTFTYAAIREAVWSEEFPRAFSREVSSASVFSVMSSWTLADLANTGNCRDDQYASNISIAQLAFEHGFSHDWTCGDVPLELCNDAGNALLRYECPVSCGCRDPQSQLFLNGGNFGCPWEACINSEHYKAASDDIACSSSSAAEMRTHENWTSFLENMYVSSVDLGLDMSSFAVGLLAEGCAFLLGQDGTLCYTTTFSLSLTQWCPVECGCRVPTAAGADNFYPSLCPSQCDSWRQRYEVFMASLPCEDGTASENADAAAFLAYHVHTFYHVFGGEEWIRSELQKEGCGMFVDGYEHMCGHPFYMRAVCPVSCGCLEVPEPYGCPLRCTNITGYLTS